MIISSEIVVSYALCPRKAFLIVYAEDKGIPHEYITIIEQQRQQIQSEYINQLSQIHNDIIPYDRQHLESGKEIFVGAELQTLKFHAFCGILTRVDKASSLGKHSYEPTIFVGTYSLKKIQKLELYFVAYVLSEIQKKTPENGQIITRGSEVHSIRLSDINKILMPFLESLQEWEKVSSPECPPIILNKHCPYCQFYQFCKDKAQQEDNLSLLDNISTPKSVKQYEKKGIFTIKQLSYLFKYRKNKKRIIKAHPTHKPELQALAIRTGKIYLQTLPSFPRQPVEFFLDIEGIPDQHSYYLIGLLIYEVEQSISVSFWANSLHDESQIWREFIEKVNQYPDAPIYHYGSYESKTIYELGSRYNTDCTHIINRLININTYIYGRVYFPTYSNGLKDIGHFIGASWASPITSGLESLVWRHYWEQTQDDRYKEALILYNNEDCYALKRLTDELSKINNSANILSEVDFANQPKFHATESGKQLYSQFEAILEFAHVKYDERKIHFIRREKEEQDENNKQRRGSKKGFQGQRKIQPKPMKTIHVPEVTICSFCGCSTLHSTNHTSNRLIIDLVLTKRGIKKTITEYIGNQGYCPNCHKFCVPQAISQYGANTLYGHGFKAFIVYQRIALHMSYPSIAELLEEQFHETIRDSSYATLMKGFSDYYIHTSELITQALLKSPVIHADETPINIRGVTQYVWVFTDGKYVVFKFGKTREATIAHEFLNAYQGILVSDFYAGYDSIACIQQKCWVHLIRDLNRDFWKNPFDREYEMFMQEIRNLLIPIMETVQKYGLKKRHLHKFSKQVEDFYDHIILDKRYKSELTIKYQKRFARYQESLFTFLEYDDTPWHNNTAERAIRHLAIQGTISGKFYESFIPSYLRLLGIRQTCRFQEKSFLKFLFSREVDISQFR